MEPTGDDFVRLSQTWWTQSISCMIGLDNVCDVIWWIDGCLYGRSGANETLKISYCSCMGWRTRVVELTIVIWLYSKSKKDVYTLVYYVNQTKGVEIGFGRTWRRSEGESSSRVCGQRHRKGKQALGRVKGERRKGGKGGRGTEYGYHRMPYDTNRNQGRSTLATHLILYVYIIY